MISATERLRALLTEHGVEWMPIAWNPKRETFYHTSDGVGFCADEYKDGVKIYTDATITPEQAVAATLGRGTCRFEQIPEALYDDIECSECGVALWGFQMDIAGEGCPTKPRYCPNCGKAVVE